MTEGKVETFHLKTDKCVCVQPVNWELKRYCSISCWSNLAPRLRSLPPVHRNLCFFYCVVWCLWWVSKLSPAAPTPAAVHTACLPPAPDACITCKLCCIHLAQTALIWTLSMSACKISVLVSALVWVLVILFCSFLYSWGKSVWVYGSRLCFLLWGPRWK